MTILAVSDVVWQAFYACAGTAIIAYFQYKTRIAVIETKAAVAEQTAISTNTAHRAAEEVQAVKKTLGESTRFVDGKIAGLANTVDSVHNLVNGAMSQKLGIIATLTRQIADLTKLSTDGKAADLAENEAREHDITR